MDGWVAVPGVGAGDGNVGVGGFEGVDWVRGGGVEGDYFSANGQIIAVRSLARVPDTVGIDPLTSLALKHMYQPFLPRLSGHWQCPIGPEGLQDWRASVRVRHYLQIEMVIL